MPKELTASLSLQLSTAMRGLACASVGDVKRKSDLSADYSIIQYYQLDKNSLFYFEWRAISRGRVSGWHELAGHDHTMQFFIAFAGPEGPADTIRIEEDANRIGRSGEET